MLRNAQNCRALAGYWLLLLAAALVHGQAAAQPQLPTAAALASPALVSVADLNLQTQLPPWPAPDSLAAQADLQTVLALQLQRSPADTLEATLDAVRGPVEWAQQVLGPGFQASRFPVTVALLLAVHEDLRAINRAANTVHAFRPRPPLVSPQVSPSLALGAPSSSYPSARTASTAVWAAVLAQVFAAQGPALLAAADRSAWLRLVGGVHFPTDLAGGRVVAAAAVSALAKQAAFQQRLAAALREAQAAVSPAL